MAILQASAGGHGDELLIEHDRAEQAPPFRALRELAASPVAAASALGESEPFRILAEVAPVGMFLTDTSGDCLFVNRRWCEMAGLTPAEAAAKGWTRALHPDDAERVDRLWYEAAEQGVEFLAEYRFQAPGGKVTWLRGRAVLLRDERGKPVGYLGALTDITDRKLAEEERDELLERERAARAEAEAQREQLRLAAEERLHLLEREQAARRESERANRLKDEFLAVVSHELRTPLTSVLGWAQILKNRMGEPDRLKKGLAIIERNAWAQAKLVDDILDVGRIMAGKLALHSRDLDLSSVVHAAVDAARPGAEGKAISLELGTAEPIVVRADADRIGQVVSNLVANAVKFTPKGGKVEIRLGRDGKNATIEVIDSGQGIPPEFLPHIWDAFRQGDSSVSRTHGGLGLGLAIVRHLIEAHGGSVNCESAGANMGSRFVVRLPAIDASMPRSSPPTSAAEHSAPDVTLDGVRVLVVDDDDATRDLIRTVLEDRRCHVRTVGTPSEALDVIPSYKPDIALLDIGLPGIDGYELLRRIRALGVEHGRDVPAIALTAHARDVDREHAKRAGFSSHVPKPVGIESLAREIKSVLDRDGRPRS